jgi:hypothetical protein
MIGTPGLSTLYHSLSSSDVTIYFARSIVVRDSEPFSNPDDLPPRLLLGHAACLASRDPPKTPIGRCGRLWRKYQEPLVLLLRCAPGGYRIIVNSPDVIKLCLHLHIWDDVSI